MMRKFLCASVATAVLASATPAMAQSYMSDMQAPLGATATVNFKVPLGAVPARERKATYGLTFGYGQQLNTLTADGRPMVRQAKMADFRFSDGFKLHKAEVMSFDLANLDKDPRFNMGPEKDKTTTWLWVGGIVIVGAGVCWAAGCFD
ncbi:MAG TPA: hypothetical protein VFU80_02005 [Sphingomicrobium sp.]|nr:hypothetical protein [Sphingomicrobium sp.]